MRTTPFIDVWRGVVSRHGLDPWGDKVPYQTARSITRAINRRTRFAWRAWDFPDFSITEERAYRQVWNSTHQYFRGDEIFHIPSVTYYVVNPQASEDPPIGDPPNSGS